MFGKKCSFCDNVLTFARIKVLSPQRKKNRCYGRRKSRISDLSYQASHQPLRRQVVHARPFHAEQERNGRTPIQRTEPDDDRLLAENAVTDAQEPRAVQSYTSRSLSAGAAQGRVFPHRDGQVAHAVNHILNRLGFGALRRCGYHRHYQRLKKNQGKR